MLRNRLYYALKPLLPWRVRNGLRQVLAQRQRQRSQSVWPVDPGTATPPANWPGWPAGRRFGVVLTHDVEGPSGVARVDRLAAVEESLGFRSSYNFIPEGSYRVSAEQRALLTDRGFEVGVHDLHHDGHLLSSRADFAARAQRINHYLREWKAVGFRAGFMLHNLDWYGDLDIEYELSTFDTDPFEPQPDAAGTIFPYWVKRVGTGSLDSSRRHEGTPKAGEGAVARSDRYLEMPYTLPQDSTLFLVLREKTPEIWLRKLDWVAARGGLVLVNVHPDYTRFSDERPTADTFPVEFYVSLLTYLQKTYAGQFWHGLPREVAAALKC